MALPSSGEITFAMINIELGRTATTPMTLNDTDVRALAGRPSGAISLSDFYGKSNSLVVFDPTNISVDPIQGQIFYLNMFANAQYKVVPSGMSGTVRYGTWLLQSMVVGKSYNVTVKNVSIDDVTIQTWTEYMGLEMAGTYLARNQSVSYVVVPTNLSISCITAVFMQEMLYKTGTVEVTVDGKTGRFDLHA